MAASVAQPVGLTTEPEQRLEHRERAQLGVGELWFDPTSGRHLTRPGSFSVSSIFPYSAVARVSRRRPRGLHKVNVG